ncbi:epoxide hydrolase 4-like isoform X2 [Penaeus monodon]|uniref:epoxide hydrolase 4-like isoform X1 n=1 Tax=Penaeus monodon TaxID=6687 RepID=UPI0018A78ACF|nr:epoxide hydrolase 4-like isoform X1 [Penaeus monodon]XP_037800068.1 epoxide hydrolase 4-like isoform X2 [Penaeus monodon]
MTSLFTKFTFLMYTVCLQTTIYIVCGVLSTIYLLFAWFKGYFHKAKERDIPPSCLRDPALGWHRFVKLKSVKLHYVEAGDSDNPLVIMIHGAPDFWFTWRKQIPSLASNYWVVAVDLRGCGDSDIPRMRTQYTVDIIAEDIVHLIGSLGREHAHLVCAGVGGQVGWHLVQRYPDLVSKMVLVHSPHPYIVHQHIHSLWKNYLKLWYLFFLQLPLLPEYAALLNDSDVIDRILKPLIRTKAVSEQEIEAYKFTFSRREDWTGALHHLRQIRVSAGGADEGTPEVVTVPILLIMGDADPILPLDTAYRSAEYVERIRIKPVGGPGYHAHVSHAEQLNRDIDDFLTVRRRQEVAASSSSSSSSHDGSESPSSSSFSRSVLGAGLSAVTSTYGRLSGAIETTRGNVYGIVHSSLKTAEQTLQLDHLY